MKTTETIFVDEGTVVWTEAHLLLRVGAIDIRSIEIAEVSSLFSRQKTGVTRLVKDPKDDGGGK